MDLKLTIQKLQQHLFDQGVNAKEIAAYIIQLKLLNERRRA